VRRQCGQRCQPLPARWPLRKSETPNRWSGSSLRGVSSLETLGKSNILYSYGAKGSPKTKYRKYSYSSDEVEELTHLSWIYMDGEAEEQLTANRTVLVSALRAPEKPYILESWQPKERGVVHCYTKLYSNLEVNSS
jgi:hypothetical protein